MSETTAAPETANESDTLTPEEESQLQGDGKAEKVEKTEPEKKETKEEKVVPYAAMHEERMRRKEIQKEMQALKERSELAEKRLSELAERFKPPVPKFEENPAAHLKHEIETVRGEIAETKKFKEEHQKQLEEQRKQTEFIENYRSQADVFRSKTPDFDKAYQFVMQSRVSELKAIGYPDLKVREIMANEERMIVEDAFNDEANPAERIYSLAKARGYAKEESEAEKQIKTVQEGVKSSKTLSKGGGTSGGLTAQALADMSEEEFAKLDEATFRKLLGG
jgi:hypothetical protein